MNLSQFKTALNEAKAQLQPLRRSRPGVALFYESNAAQKAHNQIKAARRWLMNSTEDQAHGITYEQGGTRFDQAEAAKMIAGIRRNLAAAQESR